MSDAMNSSELRDELNRDENNIYTRKYRPELSPSFSIDSFVKRAVENSEEMKPYLECSSCGKDDESEQGI